MKVKSQIFKPILKLKNGKIVGIVEWDGLFGIAAIKPPLNYKEMFEVHDMYFNEQQALEKINKIYGEV